MLKKILYLLLFFTLLAQPVAAKRFVSSEEFLSTVETQDLFDFLSRENLDAVFAFLKPTWERKTPEDKSLIIPYFIVQKTNCLNFLFRFCSENLKIKVAIILLHIEDFFKQVESIETDPDEISSSTECSLTKESLILKDIITPPSPCRSPERREISTSKVFFSLETRELFEKITPEDYALLFEGTVVPENICKLIEHVVYPGGSSFSISDFLNSPASWDLRAQIIFAFGNLLPGESLKNNWLLVCPLLKEIFS
ncbi:hypothetical protein FJ366_03745 [Candidatus Dependentiae bacterium]|nr:hypothetical protein [Candidatus Dependentiae bacterium]